MGINKPEVWIIRHKETKKQWVAASGKSSWRQKGHAKSAWAATYNYRFSGAQPKRFDDNTEYELVELAASRVDDLELRIQKMEEMVRSEKWKQLKEFVLEKDET